MKCKIIPEMEVKIICEKVNYSLFNAFQLSSRQGARNTTKRAERVECQGTCYGLW